MDEFPFNMSDFVTVDEVGDVTDLPDSPPAAVLMEIAEEGKDSATAVQKDLLEVQCSVFICLSYFFRLLQASNGRGWDRGWRGKR